ncbi:FH2 domain-containing protein formin 3 [Haematobia irritans]|uniref:FH2 domain-containing protein formin 3 n=1 Tax=Haematobia irritans TaxID=7368 RepID=UPI003F4FA3FF
MMDSRIGLDYIVENRDYISKLGTALDTTNAVVKKQVFELLSALCAYNADGYTRAIETLEFYKNLKNERYRFKIVINELEKATKSDYQVALLAFINCVIISAASLQDRIRIRNEFIGLKVLPILNNLRKVAQSVGDIIVQLDVFDEQRECDEAQSLQGPNGINLNSHLDVFYAILRQVADTPQEVPFLSILQHLLRIDPKEHVSDVVWDTTEKLVHRATLLENHEDSVRLLRTTTAQKFTCPNCRSDATSPTRKPNVTIANSPPPQPPAPAPPPPPPPFSSGGGANGGGSAETGTTISIAAPPPPPPPMTMCNGPPAPPPIPGAPPAPPPGGNLLSAKTTMPARSLTPEPRLNDVLLPQQDTPAPKTKMKTLNWGKIPPHKVIGKQNLWTIVAHNHQDTTMEDIDWNEMEGLFCLQSTSAQGSPKLGRAEGSNNTSSGGYDTLDRKSKKESTEINLLDGKRTLNVNIFLKQFKGYSSNEDIVQLIHDGSHEVIGAEKLRGLLKILPEVDEIDLLKTFNGDRQRLGRAEKFLLLLMEIPSYKLRIESMLLKEEFSANITYLDPCINTMIEAAEDLMNSRTLQEVLYLVVVAGNFLNCGGYAGNAVGVKLSSLTKLTDIRANKPGMNLIHFVAIQAEKRDPNLLNFPSELSNLENASKTNLEQIGIDIKNLDTQLQKIKRQIEMPNTDEDIKDQMMEFLQSAQSEIAVLKAGMDAVDSMRLKLADFFCEDPATFKLEECFKILQTFCDKFKQAVKENERRQQLEEQASIRQKQREEQMARRAKYATLNGTPVSDYDSTQSLDASFDPRASPALSRKRYGSFNNGTMDVNNSFIRSEATNGHCEGLSPDITPNGSMRRRRSRVLAEEDDLMEFLRTSGHERNSRERKAAYGSLDRSWARRARSGSSSRKRPDLLNIDFGTDRERAASPLPPNVTEKASPLSPNSGEISQQANDENKPRISREWRQKIENWLQSNENDEKQDEEYKRKRRLVNINRRSLENDTEGERKLDTLPEEKCVPTTPNLNTKTSNNTLTNCTTTNTNNQHHVSNRDGYKRVYSDWKPSKALETDIVGTIEAIANVNNTRQMSLKQLEKPSITESDVKFSSSQCNSNSYTNSEEVVYRRQRSVENNTTQLDPIAEEDRRKSLIAQQMVERDANERLQIYIRSPSSSERDDKRRSSMETNKPTKISLTSLQNQTASSTKVNNDSSMSKSPTIAHRFNYDGNAEMPHTSKHKEIDADNIETPPVTRRTISSPTSTLVTLNRPDTKTQIDSKLNEDTASKLNELHGVETPEVPGHFDRYSLARRTRRYKRPTDYSSGNEEHTSAKDSSEENSLNQISKSEDNRISHNQTENKTSPLTASTAVVEDKVTEKPKRVPARTITKLEKVGRHISSINQEDVQEALRNLKSPTDVPERLWSPPREILNQKSPLGSTKGNGSTIIKVSNHELNDEGFEETQSLVSDTPSHGKESINSSCNETNEFNNNNNNKSSQKSMSQKPKPIQKISSRLADRLQISRMRSTSKSQPTSVTTTLATTAPRRTPSASGDRSRATRLPNGSLVQGPASSAAAAHMSNFTNNAIRRATSLRKTLPASESPANHQKRDVERSSSRNSLRSSRSSINSATSTNTVKRMPLAGSNGKNSPLQTMSVDSSPSKRPLGMQNTKTSIRLGLAGGAGVGVPASRSSSSGSSVGPSVMVVRNRLSSSGPQNNTPQRHALGSSTSFKENQTNMGSSRPQSARSAILVKATITHPPSSAQKPSTSRSNSNTRSVSSFMRPTASSTTKRSK